MHTYPWCLATVTWRVHMCDMTHSCVWYATHSMDMRDIEFGGVHTENVDIHCIKKSKSTSWMRGKRSERISRRAGAARALCAPSRASGRAVDGRLLLPPPGLPYTYVCIYVCSSYIYTNICVHKYVYIYKRAVLSRVWLPPAAFPGIHVCIYIRYIRIYIYNTRL